jgi:hypothetical protein
MVLPAMPEGLPWGQAPASWPDPCSTPVLCSHTTIIRGLITGPATTPLTPLEGGSTSPGTGTISADGYPLTPSGCPTSQAICGTVTGHGGWRHFSPLRVFGARFSEGFGLRRMLAPSLGRPQLRFGREGFPQVQILEDRSASAKPLRETPPPCDHLPGTTQKAVSAQGFIRPLGTHCARRLCRHLTFSPSRASLSLHEP